MHCSHVLVVDDDLSIRETLSEILRDEGYEVECASNGKEALVAMERAPHPCVVLLDLMMPVMSGWEVLEKVEADKELSRIPVVVVSAMSSKGASACLSKPIDLEELLTTVHSFCPDRITAH